LTLRTGVDTTDTFDALVETARETDLAAFAHSDIPFERVAEAVAPGRNGAQSLFNVVLSFQNTQQPALELPGLTVAALDTDAVSAKFDLQVTVEPRHDSDGAPAELVTVFTYAQELFDPATVRTLGDRFERILTAVATDPQLLLGAIDLHDAAEPVAVVHSVPVDTGSAVGTALAQALAGAVEDDPDGPALAWGEEAVTYQDLDARSSRLARALISRGCGPGTGVTVRLDRGIDWAVAAWAVLKAGAALVPVVDGGALPSGPEIKIGITVTAARPSAGPAGIDWLILDDPATGSEIAGESARPVTYANRTRALRGADPAFVGAEAVYSYDALAGAVDRLRVRTELTFESRTFHQGSPDDPAALLEVVGAGTTGASMVLPAEVSTEGLADEWVTHLFSDRAGLDRLEPGPLEDLRAVLLETGPAPAGFGSAEVVVLPDNVLR
ncbi:MAG: condensation domain-containing protein, partial [Stackebrandtia sp.]